MFFNTIPYIMFGTGTVFICLFFYSLFKQKNRLAALFSLMCLSLAIYIYAYAMELMAPDMKALKYYITLEYYGFSFLPLLWIALAYKFYFNKDLSVRVGIPLAIIPFLTMFFVSTNEFHNLYFKSIFAERINGLMIVELERGIWYSIFLTYAYVLMILGSYIFYESWKKSKFNVNTQSFLFFLGSLFPLAASTIHLFETKPYGLDIIPFSFLLVSFIYFIALFKYDFLELKEIVRGYAFGQINEGIFVIDEENRIIDFNNAGELMFGWLSFDNIGKSLLDFEDGQNIMKQKGEFFEVELSVREELKTFEFRVTLLKEKGKIVGKVFLFQDITEQKLAIERLNYIATHDMLSEIYNRGRILEEIEYAMADIKKLGGKFSIMMMDIDFFKNVNDKYGHIVGDMVIKNVAHQCKSMLRSSDKIGRYGGEEFLIVLFDTDKHNAFKIAEKIRKHIEKSSFELAGRSVNITVSIGVASVSDKDMDITSQELVNNADMALYNAKNSGRNAVKAI